MPRRGFLRTVDRCTQGQTKPLYLVPDAKFLSLAPLRGFARCNQVLRSAAFANSQYEGTGSPRGGVCTSLPATPYLVVG